MGVAEGISLKNFWENKIFLIYFTKCYLKYYIFYSYYLYDFNIFLINNKYK